MMADVLGVDLEGTKRHDEEGFVLSRKTGRVGEIILNRPEKLNAFAKDTNRSVREAFDELSADEELKVVIFRGVGRTFSTGGDVGWLGTQYFGEEDGGRRPSQRHRLKHDDTAYKTWDAIMDCNKVVIAEGKGYVLGVALDWFLAADITICAEGTVLGYPPSRMLGYTGLSTLYWMIRMGPALHAEMCLMGRYISAEEGERRNLINRVVPHERLGDTVQAAADAICNLPADGLALGKYNRKIAYDILGATASRRQSTMAHSMAVQQRMEPDEWNLIKERDQYGVKGAFQRRDEKFKEAFRRYNPDAVA